MELIIMLFVRHLHAASILGPKFSFSSLFPNAHSLCPSLNMTDRSPHPYQQQEISNCIVKILCL